MIVVRHPFTLFNVLFVNKDWAMVIFHTRMVFHDYVIEGKTCRPLKSDDYALRHRKNHALIRYWVGQDNAWIEAIYPRQLFDDFVFSLQDLRYGIWFDESGKYGRFHWSLCIRLWYISYSWFWYIVSISHGVRSLGMNGLFIVLSNQIVLWSV